MPPTKRGGKVLLDVYPESAGAGQAICSHSTGHRPFGIGPKCEAGSAKIGRFFLEATGIGQNKASILSQMEAIVIPQWF